MYPVDLKSFATELFMVCILFQAFISSVPVIVWIKTSCFNTFEYFFPWFESTMYFNLTDNFFKKIIPRPTRY